MEDLSSLGTGHAHHYELRAVRVEDGKASLEEAAQPSDFIVRAEAFGVPQRRHRVIIVGIRSDLAGRAADAEIDVSGMARTVRDVIETMPALRSGISRGRDDAAAWRGEVLDAAKLLAGISKGKAWGHGCARLRRQPTQKREKHPFEDHFREIDLMDGAYASATRWSHVSGPKWQARIKRRSWDGFHGSSKVRRKHWPKAGSCRTAFKAAGTFSISSGHISSERAGLWPVAWPIGRL